MTNEAKKVREHLVEVGGRMTQDLGLGRIVGQVLVYIYFSDGEKSLDEIGDDIGLSKAAVSIAARQLEGLGLVQRVWKKGDRKNYYKTVKNLSAALQQGVLELVRSKLRIVGNELEHASEMLTVDEKNAQGADPEIKMMRKRLALANKWKEKVGKLVDSPLIKLLEKIS